MDTEDFGPIALHRQESVLTYNNRTEVLVVGSGIMGSVVARLLREGDPSRAITMIDGGKPIGEALGMHVHDVDDPVLWSRYNERAVSGIQTMYMGIATVPEVAAASLGELATGMHNDAALGKDAVAMPGAALAWNAGGLGVHWTAATPWPAGDEVFDFGDPADWAEDLAPASRVLAVAARPFEPTAAGRGCWTGCGGATRM